MLLLTPMKRRTERLIGYVVNADTVVGEWDGMEWEHVPYKAALYVDSPSVLRPMYEAGKLVAIRFVRKERINSNGQISYFVWEHPKGYVIYIYSLRSAFKGIDGADAAAGVIAFGQFIRASGGAISSPVGSMVSVLRERLKEPVRENSGPVPTERLIRGARIQRTAEIESEYDGYSCLWDISAAFPSTLAALWLPRGWKETEVHKANTPIPEDPTGFAEATVFTPILSVGGDGGRAYGPLPIEYGMGLRFPEGSILRGIWSFDELRAAQRWDTQIGITRLWTGSHYRQPFAEWGTFVNDARKIEPNAASILVKLGSNRAIGRFASDGMQIETWYDSTGTHRRKVRNGRMRPTSLTTHALVTGNVRARLYDEGIAPNAPDFLYCHTDGIILHGSLARPVDIWGDHIPLDWREKRTFDMVRILNRQSYSFVESGSGEPRYMRDGAEVFERRFEAKVFRSTRR